MQEGPIFLKLSGNQLIKLELKRQIKNTVNSKIVLFITEHFFQIRKELCRRKTSNMHSETA